MTDLLCRCGHSRESHREFLTIGQLEKLALPSGVGCNYASCRCEFFLLPVPDDPPEPAAPRDPRLRHANDQQRDAIQRLAAAIGFTLLANWDGFPTGKTRGLKMSEMFFAAHVHSLAHLLAGASENGTEEQRAGLLSLADAMLRDVFPHALADVKRLEGEDPAGATPDAAHVLVPAPKLVM